MVQLHPRVFVVQKAKTDLTEAMLKIEQEHQLTLSELFLIMSERQAFLASQCVRSEREEKDNE